MCQRRVSLCSTRLALTYLPATVSYWGLDVNLAPSSVYRTEVTLTAVSEAGSLAWVLSTGNGIQVRHDEDDGIDYCVTPTSGALLQWVTDERYDIGRLGERLPRPRRVQFAVSEGGDQQTGTRWQYTDPVSATLSVSGGSASALRTLGVGDREFDLIAGNAPMQMGGSLSATLPAFPAPIALTRSLSPAWALDLPAPTLDPPAIDLDAFQRSTHAIVPTAPILPAEYVSTGITLEPVDTQGDLYDGHAVIIDEGCSHRQPAQAEHAGGDETLLWRGRQPDPESRVLAGPGGVLLR